MSSFSSFAHSNRCGGRGQDMKYDRERSRGRGGSGSKDKIDALGRLLTRILRHMATELNLNMRSDGYVKVEDLLKLNMRAFANIPLRSQTVDDIKEAVRKDNKQRFSLLEENGELLIRANQGHTVMTVQSERLLKQILSADEVQFCVHGTYKRNLESILESGLKRMKRLHVHFSSGLLTDGEVISGMRRDVTVLIYLDVRKALEGFRFSVTGVTTNISLNILLGLYYILAGNVMSCHFSLCLTSVLRAFSALLLHFGRKIAVTRPCHRFIFSESIVLFGFAEKQRN